MTIGLGTTVKGNNPAQAENPEHKKQGIERKALISLLVTLLLAGDLLLVLNSPVSKNITTISGITGKSVSQTYAQEIFYNITCNIDLNYSWNLISSPCLEDNASVTYAVRTLPPNFISIHSFNGSGIDDTWKAYSPHADSFAVQDLAYFAIQDGYWVNVNATSNLTMHGNVTVPNFISLHTGWNLIGWTSNETKNISVALVSIQGTFTSVHAYFSNDSVDPWKVYNPNLAPGLSDLLYMIPFKGYWINMTIDATLKVI